MWVDCRGVYSRKQHGVKINGRSCFGANHACFVRFTHRRVTTGAPYHRLFGMAMGGACGLSDFVIKSVITAYSSLYSLSQVRNSAHRDGGQACLKIFALFDWIL